MNPWVSRLGVGGGSLEHRPDSEVARDRHDYEGDGRGGDEDHQGAKRILSLFHDASIRRVQRCLPCGAEDGGLICDDVDDASIVDENDSFIADRGEGLNSTVDGLEALPGLVGVLFPQSAVRADADEDAVRAGVEHV